jgi:probable phosphoglycerate mutase
VGVPSYSAPGLARTNYQRPYAVPDDAAEIILVRHGSAAFTAESGRNLVGGHSDPPLAARGHDQAQIVADRLRSENATVLSVTTLRRTTETAQPIAAALGLEPQVVADLREIRLGSWEGEGLLGRDQELLANLFQAQRWDVIPGAEPMDEFIARVESGLATVAAAAGLGGVGIAVTHGAVIAEACRQATGSAAFAFLGAENASITRLVRHADGRLTLRSYNETSHLLARTNGREAGSPAA